MKFKNTVKKATAIVTAAAIIVMTALPALAAEQKETYTSHFGVEYTVDYDKGAVEVDGTRIYLGYNASSPRVKACGWRTAVGLKSAEIADLVSIDPSWWAWVKTQYPTVEEYYRWKNGT